MCTPLRPALHVQAAAACLQECAWERFEGQWTGAGDDWPNAYRHCPMSRQEALACVVVWYHQEWQGPAFQVYHALLFGLPLAVTSFNRYSRMAEAMGRRFLAIMVSMYFDDSHITDRAVHGPSAQWSFGVLNNLLGTPFAEEKRQGAAEVGTFLGLDFDLSEIHTHGLARFWVRERLEQNVLTFMHDRRQEEREVHPGPSREALQYGQLPGAWPLWAHRFGRDPGGEVRGLQPTSCRPLMCWRPSSVCDQGGVDGPAHGRPSARVRRIPPGLPGRQCGRPFRSTTCGDPATTRSPSWSYSWWRTLTARPDQFCGRRGVWFIDNIASLMCLIRGRSDNPDLAKTATYIQCLLFALRASLSWKYIPSKPNWADAISRLGPSDPWYQANHFKLSFSLFPPVLVRLPYRAVITFAEFL